MNDEEPPRSGIGASGAPDVTGGPARTMSPAATAPLATSAPIRSVDSPEDDRPAEDGAEPGALAGEVTDESLMRAWALGDDAAFDTLHARHRGALWRYALNRTDDDAHARELFQDVWMRVVRGRSGYTPDAPFRAWLYRIARNLAIDQHRRRPTAPHEPFDEDTTRVAEIARPLQPDEVRSLAERGDALQHALARLPDAQREAIVLQHVAGMTLAEIAEVTGEPAETVKSRLRYAKTKLRQILRAAA